MASAFRLSLISRTLSSGKIYSVIGSFCIETTDRVLPEACFKEDDTLFTKCGIRFPLFICNR